MAEKKAAKKGNPLTKKLGPFPAYVYAIIGGVGFLGFRIIEGRKAASTASLGTALTGGTTIPASGSGLSSGGLPVFSSLAAWQQAAISAMAGGSLSPADALNGITDWISGQCVTAAQYSGISSIIETVGLPPGFSTVPVLSVCSGAAPAAPDNPAPAAGAPSAPAATQTYHQLSSPQAVADLLGSGGVVYQSGLEAIQYAEDHGQSAAGIDPNAYYALSAPAAQSLAAQGRPTFQSDADAQQWAALHPGG